MKMICIADQYGAWVRVLCSGRQSEGSQSGVAATQKKKEELREELVNILRKTAADHLVSDAPQPVVLANQVTSSPPYDVPG